MSTPRPIDDFRSDLSPAEVAAAEQANARSIAMQAYLHGLPAFLHLRQLSEWIQGRRYFDPGVPPLGGWVFMRDLATPEVTTVSPNVDTLYAGAYLLLNLHGPVVLTVPPIPDRYWSVAVQDAYFTNIAVIGPRTFGSDGGRFLIVPPGREGEAPNDVTATIEASTPSIFLVQRIYVRTPAEVESLRALQDAITFTPTSGSFDVDLGAYELGDLRGLSDPLRFFELVNAYTGANPPPDSDALVRLFRSAAVGPASALPEDAGLRDAIAAGAGDAQLAVDARLSTGAPHDGWKIPLRDSGTAEQGILDRAVTQTTALGINPVEEAIYFFAYRDAAGEPLDGANSYRLRFSPGGLPPVGSLGFWSLTMYGATSLLVENEIDRYVLRPDGGLRFEDDGSLVLAIQSRPPDDVPLENWLPAPDGLFNVCLRTYLPDPALVDGTWLPPGLVRAG